MVNEKVKMDDDKKLSENVVQKIKKSIRKVIKAKER